MAVIDDDAAAVAGCGRDEDDAARWAVRRVGRQFVLGYLAAGEGAEDERGSEEPEQVPHGGPFPGAGGYSSLLDASAGGRGWECRWSGEGMAFVDGVGREGALSPRLALGGAEDLGGDEGGEMGGDEGALLAGAMFEGACGADEGLGADLVAELLGEFFADEDVDEAKFVFEQEEDDAFGGHRTLAADDETSDIDGFAAGHGTEVLAAGDALAECGSEELHGVLVRGE